MTRRLGQRLRCHYRRAGQLTVVGLFVGVTATVPLEGAPATTLSPGSAGSYSEMGQG